jgi:Tfp pilus assembly protein PilF
VPPLVLEHAVRFVVADAAGNRAEAVVGPKPVEPPLRLASFTEGKTYPARGAEKVRWTLHPLAAEAEASFRVSIAHLRGRGEWQILYPKLPPGGECYWDMPEGDRDEHRIRARLHREPGGELVGEDVSPPFSIGGSDGVAPTTVRISEESRFYSDQARARADQYAAAAADGRAAGSTELEKLSADARAAFEKAIEIDPRNYHATYGLAQLLNRIDPVGNAAVVSKWLRRTIEIKPDHLWALNDVGALSIREGNFPEAESALRRCAAIDPSPIVLFNLGLALFYSGSIVEARKSFEDALKAKGRGTVPEGEAYYYIARAYFQEGERDRALALFREKEKAMPPELRQDLAKLLGT